MRRGILVGIRAAVGRALGAVAAVAGGAAGFTESAMQEG